MTLNIESGGSAVSLEEAETALGAMVDAVGVGGRCGGPWAHELTPVVKHCGVSRQGRNPVLLVNPTWLTELVARNELAVLANEMRTWFAIESELVGCGGESTGGHDRRPAA